VRYTLAALVFGLLLGVALAFGRDRLDRRLRTATEVEELLDYPIIGAIGANTLGRGGEAASASLNGTGSLQASDLEALRILRQNFQYMAAEPLRSVLVSSAMAEEGKSTVALGLAAALATAGRRTLLIDCDLRRPVIATRLGLPDQPGLTDYLTGNATLEQVIHGLHTVLPSLNGAGALTEDGLACITAGAPAPRPAELLSSDRLRRFLAEVSHAYDTVVLDSAPLLTVADSLALVPTVASVLICVRLLQTGRDHLRAAHHALARLPERPMAVVLTGVRSERDGYYYGYESHRTPATAAHSAN
jgi:capsular exopolysaccharide synthesis family protein